MALIGVLAHDRACLAVIWPNSLSGGGGLNRSDGVCLTTRRRM